MSVIVSRALPDVRDGLKPVQRRILYAMHEMGLGPQGKFRKSSAITGTTLARYHPHGDVPVYDALARMAQDFSLRYPLIDGQGNWGSIDGDAPAAARYTEARMPSIATAMLRDIEKETVDWEQNYDNTREEPKVLPSAAPQLLLNGARGIAVGMATNIPPHNLSEVVDGLIMMIDEGRENIATEDLLKHIKGPDFPTGATLYRQDASKTYSSGRGSFVVRAKADIQSVKGHERIVISELPYQVNKAALISKIADLVKEEKLGGIRDIIDESDRNGINILIDLKSGINAQSVLNQLYKKTQLQTTYHLNMIALVDGLQPRLLSLKGILEQFLDHRFAVIKRRTEYLLRKAQNREHILEGLVKALDNIDAVIEAIKKSKDREEAFKNLKKEFEFTDTQADAILKMRLQRLSNLATQEVKDQLKEVKEEIAGYKEILSKDANIFREVKKELQEVKEKYGDERRTEIAGEEVEEFSEKDLVIKKNALVTLTRNGRIKRVSPKTYKQQGRGGVGVQGEPIDEGDALIRLAQISTHDEVFVFSEGGRVFNLGGYEVLSKKRTQKGEFLGETLSFGDREASWLISKEGDEAASHLVVASRGGKIKRVALEELKNINKSGLKILGVTKRDTLGRARYVGTDVVEFMLVSQGGRAIRFAADQVPEMGRSAQGVKGMDLGKNNQLRAVLPVNEHQKEEYLLTLTEKGFGKKTAMSEFREQSRGGKGLLAGKVSEQTGGVATAAIVKDKKQDLLIGTRKGKIIRMDADSIPERSRRTKGVKTIKLESGDAVSTSLLL